MCFHPREENVRCRGPQGIQKYKAVMNTPKTVTRTNQGYNNSEFLFTKWGPPGTFPYTLTSAVIKKGHLK